MPQPHLRAADADRAAVAAALGRHMATGRLTVEEYDERLTRVYAARTYGELDELTADLPAESAPARSAAGRPTTPGPCGTPPWARRAAQHPTWHPGRGPWPHAATRRAAWGSWLTTSVIVLVIWAATSLGSGELLYFWPIWVIGPWGAVLLAQSLTAVRRGADDEQRQLRA